LNDIHDSHLGIDKCKSLARGIVWWPTLNKDICDFVSNCNACNTFKSKSSNKCELKSWPESNSVSERVHADICGPFDKKYLLVLVDSFSRWPEAYVLNTVSSSTIITCLRRYFSQNGVAKVFVTDNASYFVSEQMQLWLSSIGAEHLTIAPYHPQSNGIAERFVGTIKEHIKAMNSNNLQATVDRFLLQYRSSTHAATGKLPSQLHLGRTLNAPLKNKLNRSAFYWLPNGSYERGKVIAQTGNRMAVIEGANGKAYKRHFSQLKLLPETNQCVPDCEIAPYSLRRSTRVKRPIDRFRPG